jgi:type IV secretion system T-DNA border endonuclease VirD1
MAYKMSSDSTELPLALQLPARERKASPDPMAYRVLSVRLRDAEHRCFMEQVTELGLSANLALRIAARRISGFLEVDNETRTSLREISSHISAISHSLMTISQTAARSGTVNLSELSRERMAFGDQFVRLDARLRTILNVSMRRQDGKMLLTKSMRQKHDF